MENIAFEQHWVALYRRGGPRSGATNRRWHYLPLHFQYVRQPAGKLVFKEQQAPEEPGEYRFYLYRGRSIDVLANGPFELLAVSETFHVSPPRIDILVDDTTLMHNSPVTVRVTTGANRTGSQWLGLYRAGAPDGGTERVVYLPGSAPSLSLTLSSLSSSGKSSLSLSSSSRSALTSSSESPSPATSESATAATSTTTADGLPPTSTSIELTFSNELAPTHPGSYEVRYHTSEPYLQVLAVSRQFRVNPPVLLVSSRCGNGAEDSNPIPIGEPIDVHVTTSVDRAPKEWIALCPCGAPSGNTHGRWSYLTSHDEHVLFANERAPHKDGAWEVRYHLPDSYEVIATSKPFFIGSRAPPH